jgi:trehalose/maltose hydrolase-like predicted phosphorylase
MNGWKLAYDGWDDQQQPLRETLCTLGNGYFATRGAAADSSAGGPNYPGTYLAGGYNRLKTEIKDRLVENEDLVNWPNWLCLTFRPAGGDWLDAGASKLLEFHQELDLKVGTLERRLRVEDREGRITALTSRRFVHMAHPHLAGLHWTLTQENWSGRLEVRSALDGNVTNSGVERYRELNGRHLELLESGEAGEDTVCLVVRASQSRIEMAQAARTRVYDGESEVTAERSTSKEGGLIAQTLTLEGTQGKPLCVEKIVAIYTSRDHAISEPAIASRAAVRRAGSFASLLGSHSREWSRLWHRCDVQIGGDPGAQLALRLHIFHLLQTVSRHTIDLDVGVPARGLHGEAYRGHIFWDELFIFPFLNTSVPVLTRALLMYRYRRLPEARQAAREAGYQGAMYPWQSGSDGREETQTVHLNPRSGRWLPDHTHLQRHVNAAIAYTVWQYYQATEDKDFLSYRGAEMILEIARFWSSITTFNRQRDRYEIRGVVGPDEYHTRYPDSEQHGLDNNAYTNIMAVWVLRCAIQVMDLLAEDRRKELLEDLGITRTELHRWEEITRRMFVPFHEQDIISQFEGYEKLDEFDWAGYRVKYGDIQRLDRIVEAEGNSLSRYKVAKQADVVMLFYLFSPMELTELFERLGYVLTPKMMAKNIDYYCERTSHGSTLSRIVHSWVLARTDQAQSWRWFQYAIKSDITDIQGGTTREGIHLGAMSGTIDLFQRCFVGIELRGNVLWINPGLPKGLNDVRLRLRYRGHWIAVRVTARRLYLSLEDGWSRAARIAGQKKIHRKIGFGGKVYELEQGETKSFELKRSQPSPESSRTSNAVSRSRRHSPPR